MATPSFSTEGCRVGGLLANKVAIVGRTDSNGTAFGFNLYLDSGRTHAAPGITYEDATLAAGNNYQGTAYASGLQPNTVYYWEAIASDDAGNDPRAGNQVTGSEGLTANSFRTVSSDKRSWKVGLTGCMQGYQMTQNATKAKDAHYTVQNIIDLDLDSIFWIGDVYYADVGSTTAGYADYTQGHWFFQSSGTDDGTVGHFRTNFMCTLDGNKSVSTNLPVPMKGFADCMAEVPGYFMWDDHDRCYDDCSDLTDAGSYGTGDQNKLENGHQVGHECFMDLNRDLVNQESARDFATDCQGVNGSSAQPAEYYYVDMAPVRFIVLDVRCFRDANTDSDSSSKTMLGATQKAWLKARIDDNTQPFLVICSGVMLDGDHGYFSTTTDNWKKFSYERDEILEYIWDNGKPERTLMFSADTHNGCVIRYDEWGRRTPIYEVMTSNGFWNLSSHEWITGIAESNFRASETVSPSGNGGKLEFMHVLERNMAVIDASPDKVTVNIVETDPTTETNRKPRVVWSREYELT